MGCLNIVDLYMYILTPEKTNTLKCFCLVRTLAILRQLIITTNWVRTSILRITHENVLHCTCVLTYSMGLLPGGRYQWEENHLYPIFQLQTCPLAKYLQMLSFMNIDSYSLVTRLPPAFPDPLVSVITILLCLRPQANRS